MKKTIVSTNWLNKVIAAMMMAITTAMPAMAGNKNHNDKKDKKVENVKGVKEAKWNPRTREVTVVYDANVTSVRNIKHFMA